MNVFEFLGLPANHRPTEKVVHKVKDHDKIPKSKATWPRLVGEKKDGISAICVIKPDGSAGIFTRTGNRMSNVAHLERHLSETSIAHHWLRGSVILAELCCHHFELEPLGGLVSPERVNPISQGEAIKLNDAVLHAFDIMTIKEFTDGKSYHSYRVRYIDCLHLIPDTYNLTTISCSLLSEEEALQFHDTVVRDGGEGIVCKQPDFIWQAGKKDHCQTKMVRGCDYDLLVVGTEAGKAGTKRDGQVTNLLVRWRKYGKQDGEPMTLPVDGCFSDEDRVLWNNQPECIVGKVVHVHALQIGSQGSLRLAKVRAVRIDKSVADL